jgi:glucose-6-phosphate 1-dehydrogenase
MNLENHIINQGTVILFGATGDLSKRRIIPALYALVRDNKMGNFSFIGAALEDVTKDFVLSESKKYIDRCEEASWHAFESRFFYQKMDVTSAADFQKLADFIEFQEKEQQSYGNRLIYMAVHPKFFALITEQLANSNIISRMAQQADKPWYRVVYEKPFGSDRKSAREINRSISKYLQEFQIFRVDHYLAKDIVGTLALLRFTNRIFEPLWNSENIDWIEIILSETVGMNGRGAFYDTVGALKDVVQNHMLQIVALLAMEAPEFLTGDYIRDQKAVVLQKIEVVDGIFGQYKGYKQEKQVNQNSTTETFAALKLKIDTPRWQGVPFYLKTGKCLSKKETIITIQFKPAKCLLSTSCPSDSNYLTIRVMPEPGFSLVLNVKKPGLLVEVMPVAMDFCYECKFGFVSDNVYELVLQEVLSGEQAISVRFDEIEYAWDVIDRLKELYLPLYEYEKGTRGPDQLQEFAQRNGMKWRY